jgi:signal transduction histidine kinase/CheY-like chemotaxis protein
MTSYSEQTRLQGLLVRLNQLSRQKIDDIDQATTKFFLNLDQLATKLFDSATVKQKLDAEIGKLAMLQQGQTLNADGKAAATLISGQVLQFLIEEDPDKLEQEVASLQRTIAGLKGGDGTQVEAMKSLLNAEQWIIALKHRLLTLMGEVRRQLAEIAALSTGFIAAAEKGINLAYLVEPGVPGEIAGDSLRLRQVLLNLLNNAIKFTEKGDVFRRVSRDEPAASAPIPLRFAISDSGPGVPEGKKDKLFQSFSQLDASTTRRHGGTGLGLAISKKLVELMGGRIWVDSEPGPGATFIFTISAAPVAGVLATAAEPADAIADPAQFKGRRILVVDDNRVNRRVLRAQIASWHMTPVIAADPEEGLRFLSDGGHYDLAILDLTMPEVDGIGLARALRAEERHRALLLVFFTSVVPLSQTQRESVRALGFAEVLAKPIKPSALQNAVQRVLGGGSRGAAGSAESSVGTQTCCKSRTLDGLGPQCLGISKISLNSPEPRQTAPAQGCHGFRQGRQNAALAAEVAVARRQSTTAPSLNQVGANAIFLQISGLIDL